MRDVEIKITPSPMSLMTSKCFGPTDTETNDSYMWVSVADEENLTISSTLVFCGGEFRGLYKDDSGEVLMRATDCDSLSWSSKKVKEAESIRNEGGVVSNPTNPSPCPRESP
jgi:hypothetical protein